MSILCLIGLIWLAYYLFIARCSSCGRPDVKINMKEEIDLHSPIFGAFEKPYYYCKKCQGNPYE